jgi:superfamily I DNA/RNA helicase
MRIDRVRAPVAETAPVDRHAAAKRRRQEHVEAVVADDARNKIVVAGPGTGKTFLFRSVLSGKKNTLTLTFVNALVEDLSLELFGISEVRTLHGFARQQLEKAKGESVPVFPKLSAVIRQDALVLLGREVDFDVLFHIKADGDEDLQFYRSRSKYYGHYGFSDMVYAAVRYFERHPEKIPHYTQVVVDEFQDFNLLEVMLIEQLASRSPVLLAGDDDQALYETLKCASADHIRHRHGNRAAGYASFELPYCSRCTRVIVDATNDVIANAKRAGYLRGRIEKPFRYFDDPKKDRDSDRYPSLVHAQVFAKQIPWFIQERIKDIATAVRDKFTVLILSPTRTQCRFVAGALREKGFGNVHYVEKQEAPDPTLLEGLSLLLEDNTSNLGWRIVAKALNTEPDFAALLAETAKHNPPAIPDLIAPATKKVVKTLLHLLRAARDGKQVEDDAETGRLLKAMGIDPIRMAMECLRDQVPIARKHLVDFGVRRVLITATTIPSAKGLAADYVFITHFDDRYFIKNQEKGGLKDQEICSFLVALTRAIKQVFLISSDRNRDPTFLQWIDAEHISEAG